MEEKMKKPKITLSKIFKMWYRNFKSSLNRGKFIVHFECMWNAVFHAKDSRTG